MHSWRSAALILAFFGALTAGCAMGGEGGGENPKDGDTERPCNGADLLNDDRNCGVCGNVCGALRHCGFGRCTDNMPDNDGEVPRRPREPYTPPGGDEPPVDEPPGDEPPVDEPPGDEPPVDEPPVDVPPGGETPTGDDPAAPECQALGFTCISEGEASNCCDDNVCFPLRDVSTCITPEEAAALSSLGGPTEPAEPVEPVEPAEPATPVTPVCAAVGETCEPTDDDCCEGSACTGEGRGVDAGSYVCVATTTATACVDEGEACDTSTPCCDDSMECREDTAGGPARDICQAPFTPPTEPEAPACVATTERCDDDDTCCFGSCRVGWPGATFRICMP